MSITLLDIYAIAGFSPFGRPIDELMDVDAPHVPDSFWAYGKFMRRYRSSSGLISDHKHVACLASLDEAIINFFGYAGEEFDSLFNFSSNQS